jgi:predicted nucleic acid-binding Zn ribbon protein
MQSRKTGNMTRGSSKPLSSSIAQMREHFQATGAYRAEDVHRVLGDQRKGVRVALSTSAPDAAHAMLKR